MNAEEFKRTCERVEGYTALGLLDEAGDILEDLPSALKVTKEVITLQMGILLKAGEFLKASFLAETLCRIEPDADRFLMVARYRFKGGDIEGALAWFANAEGTCSGDSYFHYLAAQCHASLGDQEKAKASLKSAFERNPAI